MANITITMPSGVSTYTMDLAPYCGYKITVNSAVTYDVTHCGSFGAYYTNSHGGWDAFLFEGNCKRTDTFDAYSIDRPFDNNTIDHESKTYLNDITLEYELNTGWLTDAQAENFAKNFIQSTNIYLHDLVNDKIFPVVITDTEAPFKKYIDNRRRVSYTVNVRASQKRIRR